MTEKGDGLMGIHYEIKESLVLRILSIFGLILDVLISIMTIISGKQYQLFSLLRILTVSFLWCFCSVCFFIQSYLCFVIDEKGVFSINKLLNRNYFYSWNDYPYACYHFDHKGKVDLIISSRELSNREKIIASWRIYICPSKTDIFRMGINPDSEMGKDIFRFIEQKYGVSYEFFCHRGNT